MPSANGPHHQSTDGWNQLLLLVASPEQATHELLRPIVLFGQPIPAREFETGAPERTLHRRVARFDALGMQGCGVSLDRR